MKSALLLGFGSFTGFKINPAGVIAKSLNGLTINDILIEGLEIPVSVRFVRDEVPKIIMDKKPDIVLGIGVAPVKKIQLERVAINLLDFRVRDVDGYKAEDEKIFEDGPNAYFTNLDVKSILKSLKDNGIPSIISYSAGTYLCNALFYTIMYAIDKHMLKAKGGFVHIPVFPEMAVEKDIPSMSKELIESAIRRILSDAI